MIEWSELPEAAAVYKASKQHRAVFVMLHMFYRDLTLHLYVYTFSQLAGGLEFLTTVYL